MISVRSKQSGIYLGSDILGFALTILISLYLFGNDGYTKLEWSILIGFFLLWLLIRYWPRLYYSELNSGVSMSVSHYFKSYSVLIVSMILLYLFFPMPTHERNVIIALVLSFPVLSIAVNYALITVIDALAGRDGNIKYTLVAGTGKLAEAVEKKLNTGHNAHYQIKGFISCMKTEERQVGQNKIVGDLKDISQYLKTNHVDEIYIALPFRPSKKIRNIISAADYHGVRVKYIPDYSGLFGESYRVIHNRNIDAISIHRLPLDDAFSAFLKSSFDKVFSAIALTLLAPLFLVLIILIKLDSPGPVFYSPTRIGRGGRPFKLYKFRSMRENDMASGGMLSTQEDDPRIAPLGRFLRKYSLDELPQFINVLLGNMSVVGPRPHRSFLNHQLQETVNKYMIRHYVKPGITGWAQVNGWRGPTLTEEQKLKRTQHDLWYIEQWSFRLDIKIIFLTIFSKKVRLNAF
jgi:Undecaprenyl-phosphate glucose phosphotransferase